MLGLVRLSTLNGSQIKVLIKIGVCVCVCVCSVENFNALK